ncbi:amino acid permease [Streptomyces sp. NPDC021093]|uniref:amino acid permease n=1 Tax=Streptomyces sp. NPDC021093 TaxID=3365112 RepID=UPI0037BCA059
MTDGGTPEQADRRPALKSRHLTMIGLGGVIGSGLFVGSGAGIASAGPGILLSFMLAGALATLVMRMLGELAAALPDSGSFSAYAERAFGSWAGFTVGWLHWWTLCIAIAAEATAAGAVLHGLAPAVPHWCFTLAVMSLFTVLNLAAVGVFGEFEFWLAGIKVAALVGFLVLGALAIAGLLPGVEAPGTSLLTGHGGFLPHGWAAVVTGFVTVLFSFGGMEVVAIGAAESRDPSTAVVRAVRATLWRILLFFIGSIAVIVMLLPWDSAAEGRSPFVAVLDRLGIPAAAGIMDVVILVALLSALNANLYAASRMVRSLADRGEAPRRMAAVSRRGAPWPAVLLSTGLGFVGVLLTWLSPDTVFPFLATSIGATMLFVWLAIVGSQIVLRPRLEREAPHTLRVRMWGFPYLSWVALAVIIAGMALMATSDRTRPQLLSTSVVVAVLLAVAAARARRSRADRAGKTHIPEGPARAPLQEPHGVLVVGSVSDGGADLHRDPSPNGLRRRPRDGIAPGE